jgi:hypothetical protein
MPIVLLVLLCAWLLVIVFAVLLCTAARRTDDEIAGTELAPVIDIKSSLARQNVA